ncbi:uncharacterized protein METZ01_LOCUS383390, partial [marine metagenome]
MIRRQGKINGLLVAVTLFSFFLLFTLNVSA